MLQKQSVPTLYFIGVTTKQSSIMRVFPRWSDILGLGAQIIGYDALLHAPAEDYRRIVQHIKDDPLSMGALVTTHKLDLLTACRDLFDELDPYAQLCGEVSCIAKRDGKLMGYAKDPISSGLALENFVPVSHWVEHNADVLCLGAGGAAIAISVYLAEQAKTAAYPHSVIVCDVREDRLAHIEAIHANLDTPITFSYRHIADVNASDTMMATLPEGSLVINATGLGKDRPGSPISADINFPHGGIVWELNYRGTLEYLHHARQQADARQLIVEDGWVYFLHGWTQVIAEVFDVMLTPDRFTQLDEAASDMRPS